MTERREKTLSKYVTGIYSGEEVIGAIVKAGDLQADLDASTAKMLIRRGRFIGDCSCRPILSEATSFLLVGGEDDCRVHGLALDE
jgi:hypothetical protein